MSDLLTLDIESIAAGGDGVARHEGLVVFVPRSAPGDRVLARVQRGRRFARGRVEFVERASPVRVDPQCAHYAASRCGGCQLQHLDIHAQGAAKCAIVRDTMRRIAHRTIDLPTFHAAPSPWRYRERLSLAAQRRADGSWFGGLHAWDDPAQVFELDDCLITNPRVLALWRCVLAASELFPEADALRITVKLAGERGALMVEGGHRWPAAAAFVERLPEFSGVWWTPERGRRRRVDAPAAGARAAAYFSQVNPAMASALFTLVAGRVAAVAPSHVLDAYSGAGDLAADLHARGIRVTAIELDEEASSFAATRLPRPSRAIAARVEDVIGGLLPADAIVVNPPRAGLDDRVTTALDAAAGTRLIVYVSCDPATLARDIGRLPSWAVSSIDAFDMFPQTAHVETVVALTRSVA